MSSDKAHADAPKFGDELKLLLETVLERVEPALRRAAIGADKEPWSSCDWCPACAAAALLRGEHHDVLSTLADHGTAAIIVLREALAGIPVEPVYPPEFDGAAVPQQDQNPAGTNGQSHPASARAPKPAAKAKPAKQGGKPPVGQFVNIPVTIKPIGNANDFAGHNR